VPAARSGDDLDNLARPVNSFSLVIHRAKSPSGAPRCRYSHNPQVLLLLRRIFI